MFSAKVVIPAVLAVGVLYVAGSWILAGKLSKALISPAGLTPGEDHRQEFLAALRAAAPIVEPFTHRGDPLDPVTLRATFASPGNPGTRTTILFLHGKGGNASEWTPDAVRALSLGYNVLVPDLRGQGGSGGAFITYGFLEKGDLAEEIRVAAERFHLDPARIAVHACSAGSLVALQFCADNAACKALWLESPFGDPVRMARHYLHLKTKLPEWLLALPARFAMERATTRIARALHIRRGAGWTVADPVAAARRIRCPVLVVYGRDDELALPDFVPSLLAALPKGSASWEVDGAGHCHHPNEPEAVASAEYVKRWGSFFTSTAAP